MDDKIIYPVNEMIYTNNDINIIIYKGQKFDIGQLNINQIIRPDHDKCKHCKACYYEENRNSKMELICLLKSMPVKYITVCKFDGDIFSKVLYTDEQLQMIKDDINTDNLRNDMLEEIVQCALDSQAMITREAARTITLEVDYFIENLKEHLPENISNIDELPSIICNSEIYPLYMDYRMYAQNAIIEGYNFTPKDNPKYYELLTIPLEAQIGVAIYIGGKVSISIPNKYASILNTCLSDLESYPGLVYKKADNFRYGDPMPIEGINRYYLTLKHFYSTNE